MNAKEETRVVERRIVKTHLDLSGAIVSPKGLHTMRTERDALVRNVLWGQSVNINNIEMIGNSQKNHCYQHLIKSADGNPRPG